MISSYLVGACTGRSPGFALEDAVDVGCRPPGLFDLVDTVDTSPPIVAK
jgi:hypothetical protein